MSQPKQRFDVSLNLHALLCLLALMAAYSAWTQPNLLERDNAVVLLSGSAASLTALQWQDEQGSVTLRRDQAQHIDVSFAPAPLADGSARTPITFPGNLQAHDLFARMLPFLAVRQLGPEAEPQAAQMGLSPAKATLTLTRQQQPPLLLLLGEPAYGSGDLYARSPNGPIYLVRPSSVAPLRQGATGLQDREIVGISRQEVHSITITYQGQQRSFVHRHAEAPQQAFFADPADPDRRLGLVSSFMESFLRLRAIDSSPQVPPGAPAVSVTFMGHGEQLAETHLYASGGAPKAFATSTRLQATAVLQAVGIDALLREVSAVMAEGR